MIDHDQADHKRTFEDDMERAFETALTKVLSNEDLTKKFWARGYAELVSHAEGNASKWVGRRILTSLIIACATAGLIWLVRTGGIK